MTRRPGRAAAAVLAVVLGLAGAYGGSLLASPDPAVTPTVVAAAVSPGGPVGSRDALVGVTGEALAADAMSLLTAASRALDPIAEVESLRPRFELRGADDSCGGCGTIARIVPEHKQGFPGVVATGRPPALVYAVTPDLIAVTVPHRAGDTVRVFPNTLNGDEPVCDPVIAGYDFLAREVGRVEVTLDDTLAETGGFDPAFDERTTVGFDINEGLGVVLCAEVIPAGANEPDYRAQAIVRTADRLQPTVSVEAVSGLSVPGWSLRGYLPSGQRCGTVQVPSPGDFARHSIELDPARVLCDYTDILVQRASTPPAGRGVLPLSVGDRSTFTLEQFSWRLPPERFSIDLGPTALCTGFCVTPPARQIVVTGERGEVTLRLTWSQGNTNGVKKTTVEPLTDTFTVPSAAPELDVISSTIRQTGFDVVTRSGEATLQFRATQPADFTARLVSDGTADFSGECWRENATREVSGSLGAAQGWSLYEQVTFTGLCAGENYHAVVELSNSSGSSSTGWPAGALRTNQMAVSVDIEYVLSTDVEVDDAAVALTIRSDDATIVGPRAGGCLAAGELVGSAAQPELRWGERVRLSGTLQLASSSSANECALDFAAARPAITFETEFTLEQFFATPQGMVFDIGGPDGARAVLSIRSP